MNLLQNKASNPNYSSWVSASAGTGKTKILTDRVLRLLLKGAAFDKILCLTFTNAAAAEMGHRISASLSRWANMTNLELEKDLKKLSGFSPNEKEINLAKNLFVNFLNAQNKIQIQTIHSFCQRILKQFPIEAGVNPGFTILDEIRSNNILQQIKNTILNEEEFFVLTEYLSANFHETTIDETLNNIISGSRNFCMNKNILTKELLEEIVINLRPNIFEDQYVDLLNDSCINLIPEEKRNKSGLMDQFFTKKGDRKTKPCDAKIAKAGTEKYDQMLTLQRRVYDLNQKEKEWYLLWNSRLIELLGREILSRYIVHKQQERLLDYNDLINMTANLLQNGDTKEWVLYKLDGGIDHLLVDEAQDTSPSQWEIIKALIEEFYAGDSSSNDRSRTVFVVGDDKQSIFSFQGADVESFNAMNDMLKRRLHESKKEFHDIELEISYRSCSAIIEATEQVFSLIKKRDPDDFKAKFANITPNRSDHEGSVRIWPIEEIDEIQEQFWPINEENLSSGKYKLANKIAEFINQELKSKIHVPSKGRAAKPEDFMILFRTRNELTSEVIKALNKLDLKVSGLDRIFLQNDIIISDLISVAKFVICPIDDLNLAALLKSPLINITEEELYNLAINRKDMSIWEYIQLKTANCKLSQKIKNQLDEFLLIYQYSDVSNFFTILLEGLELRLKFEEIYAQDAKDAIAELLNIAQNFATEYENSLQSFIFLVENSTDSIKRNNNSMDKIRIMTVHGAKGLQSPYVILCDTTTLPSSSEKFIWGSDGEVFFPKNLKMQPELYKDLKEKKKQNEYKEYLRLLYVAMTRAEDNLIVCGYRESRSLPENCWYNIVYSNLAPILENKEDGSFLCGEIEDSADKDDSEIQEYDEVNQVDKCDKNHFIDNLQQEKLTINKEVKSPLISHDSLKYGTIFHKILEDIATKNDILSIKDHPLITSLSENQRIRMQKSMDLILENKIFTELLSCEKLIEVPIGMSDDNLLSVGRIDLLIFKENQIIIIDYKSDKTPAVNIDAIPPKYKEQLNQYQEYVQKIYPDNNVVSKILWLENGEIMSLI